MIRYFCDRCKREVNDHISEEPVPIPYGYEELIFRTSPDMIDGSQRILKKYMLCSKCCDIVINMIETNGTVDVSQLWKR